MSIKILLEQRDDEYGEAWLTTSRIVGQTLQKPFFSFCTAAPDFIFPWMMILNKLIRSLKTPHNQDHWRDIIGYATLILNTIGENHGKAD